MATNITNPANGEVMKNPETAHQFVPKEDITVYELAKIMSSLLSVQNAAFSQSMFAALPTECQRHFESVVGSPAAQKQHWQLLT